VFRSSELCSLTDADLDTITKLGIRVVFDLRAHAERRARPSRLPAGVTVEERTTPARRAVPAQTLEELIAAGSLPTRDDDLVADMYIWQLDGGLAPELRRVLELAVDSPNRPLLFHCAAGKDRTGIAAAVLLGVLGVAHDDIVDDYARTTTYWARPRLEALDALLAEHGLTHDHVRHLLEARTAAFEHAIAHLHDRWGGYDAYAIRCLGLPDRFPHQLRTALTT
jgi:protein-tyrosine phosphatase